MEPIIFIVLVLIGYALGSAKLINQGNEALVERLGQYHRKLKPGLNFIVPLVDQIVMEDTTREQFLDIKPQNVITQDNIYVEVDAIVYWRIRDIEKSFYAIEDLQGALTQVTTTTLREIIAQNTLEQTNVSRAEMHSAIIDQLNEVTGDWGVEILRLDLQRITLPESVRKSREEQQAAEIKKRALITEAEGEKEAAIKKAEGTMASVQIISQALRSNPDSRDILRYLVAQDYVDASQKLGESTNAKIVFVDPANSSEMFQELIAHPENPEGNGKKHENGNT
ncbi:MULTISPECIES: SPFH domain-containing protein [unclassified Nostoc]|uniref:SPFH domain-containing protein n=1 Tax=unclassified Nostoc TaxID=2593658 RepID=UPI002AD1FBD0|nr:MULTISPECIES: SPFH domain-containing protein [unclassified Nostoc]MDZ8125105.1 SPFH domain-containing protein [Nostoc sp. CmiVER01]MDZ8226370.1 SPFH domain-containing protein [Nostoc sp. ChiVER01]